MIYREKNNVNIWIFTTVSNLVYNKYEWEAEV